MDIIIALNILVILIAYFARFKNTKYMLELSFVIIFIFSAIRYNFGTDYMSYYSLFRNIQSNINFSSTDLSNYNLEFGWLILNYLFNPIGFFGFIIALSAFLCYTYYSLIKKHVSKNYYWLAVLLYVFTFDIMLIQFSAIRQALAIAIFINSTKYISDNKSPIKFILLIILASTIHSSAIFLLIFAPLAFKKVGNSKLSVYIIPISFFTLLLFGEYFLRFVPLVTRFFTGDRYLWGLETQQTAKTTLIGGLIWSLLFMIILYSARNQSDNIKPLFYLFSIYFIMLTIGNLVFISDRLSYYFAPFSIIIVPLTANNEKKQRLRIVYIALFIFFALYKLFKTLSLDWIIEGYSYYKTIFGVLF